MLKRIRKNTKLILWTLLALIVPPFMFFGIESAFVRGSDPLMGTVFGKKIFLSNFLKAKTFAATMMSLTRPGPVDPTFLDQMAWQRLIFLHQAQNSGIQVSNSELSQAIKKNFARGDFDPKSYELFVRRALKLSVFEFEKAYRETLLIEKFQNTLTKLVQVSEKELDVAYFYEREKLDVRYCEIPTEKFLNKVNVSEKELSDYFDQHQASFRVGVQRKVSYISIPLKDLMEKVHVSPRKIEKYYRKHKKSFKKPLAELSKEIENQLRMSQAKAMGQRISREIYDELSKGQFIQKVAEKFSTPHTISPFFTQENPPFPWKSYPELVNGIFQNRLKEPLEPVDLDETFYVIVPSREKPPYLPEFSQVKERIQNTLMEEKAFEEAKKSAQEALEKVRALIQEKGISFSKACQVIGEKSHKLTPFTRSESKFASDPLRSIKQIAWDLPIGEISNIEMTQKGYAFGVVRRSLGPSPEEFEKEKTVFKERLLNRTRQKVLYEYYDWLLKQCQFFELKKKEL